jgi:hypothetical protein
MSAAAAGSVDRPADRSVDREVDGDRDAVTNDQETARAATTSSAERRTTAPRLTNLDKRPSPEADART